jgi:hypothetical protein
MKVSRRDFVSTMVYAAAAGLCAFPTFGVAGSNFNPKASAACTLLDLESNCALPESFEGMQVAFVDAYRRVTESEFSSGDFAFRETAQNKFLTSPGALLIVAGAGTVGSETFGVVAGLLEKGARVVWESGAAFLKPHGFARQQALSREYFGISLGRPIDLWSQSVSRNSVAGPRNTCEPNRTARSVRAIGQGRVPYVSYRWPHEAHIRDFSRAIPVTAANGHAIGHWGELSVAWSKPVGAGTLVFLGSPIGPALRANDSEAHSLLRSMIAS